MVQQMVLSGTLRECRWWKGLLRMAGNDSKKDWFGRTVAAIGLVVSLGSLGVSTWALCNSQKQHKQTTDLNLILEQLRIEREKPSLEANSNTLKPEWGRPGPTIVPLFNPGKQEALVVKIEFLIARRYKTPKETPKVGFVPAVPIGFRASDYDEQKRRFSIVLRRPIGIPGGQNVVLHMAIVEPRWVGFSYVGNALIHYDRGEPLLISGVMLDVCPKSEVPNPQ